MGTTPEAVLARLEPGAETPAGAVRGLAAIADSLAAQGLVALRRDGRKLWVTLTPAGEARRGPSGARTRTRPRAHVEAGAALADRVDRLEALVAALTTRIEELASRLADRHTHGNGRGDGHHHQLEAAILAAITDLDARLGLGGIVPIPDLRAELHDRNVRAPDEDVTSALEALERAWKIDLAAAQAPTQVAHRRAGIERPGRGLLYYIARR